MLTSKEIFDECWRFIRGDTPTHEFESWVYKTSELESSFSEDFYMTLISTDFALEGPVYVLKEELKNNLSGLAERECECHTLPNSADVGMGEHDHIFASLDESANYGEPLWWLWLAKCSVCGQYWMIASEERINDVFVLKRLSNSTALEILQKGQWPDDFKEYSSLLQIGRDRGHSVRFVDPVSPALVQTVIDLAKANPGIEIQQISNLLQVDLKQAEAIVDVAVKQTEVSISRS